MKKMKVLGVLVLVFVMTFSLTIISAPEVNAVEEVDLTFWTFVDAHADYFVQKVEEFNEANDDYNINLLYEVYPYQEMHNQLQIALQTGIDVPDLVDIEIRYFNSFASLEPRPLLEVNDIIEPHQDAIIEARLSPYSIGDSVYGVPTHLGAMLMYYNAEIFEEEGLDVDDIETWADFREMGMQITKDLDGDGEIDRYMLALEVDSRWSFHAVTRQLGSNVIGEDFDIVVDREENRIAWEKMQQFILEDEIAITAPGGNIEEPAFYGDMTEGRFAAVMRPQWYMIRMTDFMPELEGKIKIRALPRHEEGGARSGMGGGTGTSITRFIDEDKIEPAKAFLEFAKLTYDANISIWQDFGLDPFRSDVYEDESLYEPIPYFANEVVMETILEIIENDEIPDLYTGEGYMLADDLIDEFFLIETLQQGRDVQEALDELAERLRDARR